MRMLSTSILLSLMLVGCSSPTISYYKLSSEPIPVMAGADNKMQLMVGPVSVPGGMDRPQLVVQSGGNESQVFEYRRWSGSLKSEIARVIGASLARDLGAPNVWNFAESTQTNFDYQIFIDVQNLESNPGDSVLVDVLWTIKPGSSKSMSTDQNTNSSSVSGLNSKTKMGRSLVRESVAGSSFDALVAAQSRAFSKVGMEIAQSIRN
ncbi:membrane integrity-associated transporter subunit PqiC [Polynucleobacter sp. JS-Safj-400b-B2]|uniref:PqiC family protein n=1 Tax=Polynucleobacter sp. JS-Safj-400b-B2 TaxID=2576921 RepID=UPI001C0BC401|nr:PqiC family protein [Polynucleobacter sp. JS-Safj-400b-B2]MBU3627072.1 membrane integrity-associated transporter subunit PqiC [Polynucleobacter sp. JS-Safj-400b-B2]